MIKTKAVFIGDSGVGKTSLFQRFESNEFHDEHVFTVGGAYAKISVETKSGRTVDIGLWDTAGQERFRNIIPMYFQRADFVLVVYDVTSRDSFESLNEWITLAKEKAPQTAKIIIVGNKLDLTEQRCIGKEECADIAEHVNAEFYIETSAKTAQGLDILQQQLGEFSEQLIAEDQTPETVEPIRIIPSEEIQPQNENNQQSNPKKCCL